MVDYPITHFLCLSLCTVECGLVSERVTWANSHFFVNDILNFGTVMIIQVFYFSIRKTVKCRGLFCSFWNFFILHNSEKNVGKVTVIQTSIVPHISSHCSCTPNYLLCGFLLFWRTKLVSLSISKKRNSQLFNKLLYLPAQKVIQHKIYCADRNENGRQKDFYEKAKA